MDDSEDADPLWQLPSSPQSSAADRDRESSSTPEKDNEELRRILRSKCHQVRRMKHVRAFLDLTACDAWPLPPPRPSPAHIFTGVEDTGL